MKVVDASLAVDIADVGRDTPVVVGGRRLVDPSVGFLEVGVLERKDGVTDGAEDFGRALWVLIMEGVLDPAGEPPDGVRGVTFVIRVLVSGGVFVGVVAVVESTAVVGTNVEVVVGLVGVDTIEAELGVNFESGRGPTVRSGFCLFGVSGV